MTMMFHSESHDNTFQGSFPEIDYSLEDHSKQELVIKPQIFGATGDGNQMVEYCMLNNQEMYGGFIEERADKGVVEGVVEVARLMEVNTATQPRFLGKNLESISRVKEAKRKRKRLKTMKTREEAESQRMNHIAVERNRRRQMNEHLCVLRSLMPSSFVQRPDQASIIGGAIEFVRELEQLLGCLESQKWQLPEEIAEMKSCLVDNVEVKVLGFDASIKILSRRRPGQLTRTIAALEDLQLNIVRADITTDDQNVLYSFSVKMSEKASLTAEDIANSIQQVVLPMTTLAYDEIMH